MTNEASFMNVQILKNGKILKVINEPIKFEPKWTSYRQTLRRVQKNVNLQLSELVDSEKSAGEEMQVDDDSDSESENTTYKRKLDNPPLQNKKVKA